MKKIIGIDQENRAWLLGGLPGVKKALRPSEKNGVAYIVLGLTALIGAVFILFAASSAASAQAPVCYAVDHEQVENVYAPDMDGYLLNYGNGEDHRLWDLGD